MPSAKVRHSTGCWRSAKHDFAALHRWSHVITSSRFLSACGATHRSTTDATVLFNAVRMQKRPCRSAPAAAARNSRPVVTGHLALDCAIVKFVIFSLNTFIHDLPMSAVRRTPCRPILDLWMDRQRRAGMSNNKDPEINYRYDAPASAKEIPRNALRVTIACILAQLGTGYGFQSLCVVPNDMVTLPDARPSTDHERYFRWLVLLNVYGVGAFIGAILLLFMSNRFGRRLNTGMGLLLAFVGGVVQASSSGCIQVR